MSKLKRGTIEGQVPEGGRNPVSLAESILDFWFNPETGSTDDEIWSRWFVPNPEFDRECMARFLASYESAADGRMGDWVKEPRSCLALVLLLDQIPRNIFRDTARAFATDANAREVSRHAIASGFDRELSPIKRMFLYLPFQHSEDLDDQLESVRLTSALTAENPDHAETLKFAEQHLEMIERFGRFPGRNRALGRQSTQEEIDFLKHSKRK